MLGLEPCAVRRPSFLPGSRSPSLSAKQALASGSAGDMWQERAVRVMEGGRASEPASGVCPPLRVPGCLPTWPRPAGCPGPGRSLTRPGSRPRTQPCKHDLPHGKPQVPGVPGTYRSGPGCSGREFRHGGLPGERVWTATGQGQEEQRGERGGGRAGRVAEGWGPSGLRGTRGQGGQRRASVRVCSRSDRQGSGCLGGRRPAVLAVLAGLAVPAVPAVPAACVSAKGKRRVWSSARRCRGRECVGCVVGVGG